MRLKPWPPRTEAGARWRWRARATRAAPWWSASAIRVLGCHRGRRHRSSTPSSRPRQEGSASACLSADRSSRRTADDFGHKRTTSTELRSRLSYLLRLRADSRLAFLSHLDKLPRRLQPRVKAALHEVMYAETREKAREAITRFAGEYGAKYPKAVTTLEQDADVLLTFFDFPAAHWKHLRTSNVIESPFATVRLRQRVTKGAGARTKGLLMAYKLLDMAQAPLAAARRRTPPALVRADVVFADGIQQEGKAPRTKARAA